MAEEHYLAGDSWIPALGGPKHVSALSPGDGVFIVKPDGTTSHTEVSAVEPGRDSQPCISLLCRIGEIIVPERARVVTRQGLQRPQDIISAYQSGVAPRLEIVHPITMDLHVSRDTKTAYRQVLATLPRPRAVVAEWLDEQLNVSDRIVRVLKHADVGYNQHHLDAWRVIDFDPPSAIGSSPWAAPGDQAVALMLLMAWSAVDGEIVARLLADEVECLQRLCGCLAVASPGYEVKWLPAYRPLEARIYRRDTSLMSHVPVIRTVARQQFVYRVRLADPGAVIVSSALLR